MNCKTCGKPVETKITVDGFTYYRGHRSYCFSCSPPAKLGVVKDYNCEICDKQFTHKSSNCGIWLKYCNTCASRVRRYKRKLLAIEYKGGCCQLCGYNKSLRAMHFHHLDPSEKDYQISNTSRGYTLKSMKEELDKCILLCANCHGEAHEKIDNEKESKSLDYRKVKTKQFSIKYKGGCCQECGYNKSSYSLHFHHLDKDSKEFKISTRNAINEKLINELEKCILLCGNCHLEKHVQKPIEPT